MNRLATDTMRFKPGISVNFFILPVGIKRLENLYISIGITYINLKKYTEAIKSFEQVIATEAKGQHIKIARQWINYTQSFIKDSTNTASLNTEPEQ